MISRLPRRLLSSVSSAASQATAVPASLRVGTKLPSLTLNYESAANARFYLLAGGEELAQQSSHDPSYEQSRKWISAHPIGPTVIDPFLLSGGLHSSILAWSPGSQVLGQTFSVVGKPVVVGEYVTLEASVVGGGPHAVKGLEGYAVTIKGVVKRAGREKKVAGEEAERIVEGEWRVWVPPHIVEGHFGKAE